MVASPPARLTPVLSGKSEQVEAASWEAGARWDSYIREDCLLSRALGQGPVGDVNATFAGIIEFDKRIRRVGGGTGADTEFVNLNRAHIPHLLCNRLGFIPASCLVFPRGAAQEVAVEGRRSAVTLNVALTLAPVVTGPAIVADLLELPTTAADHCFGRERLNSTSDAGAPVVFVKVTAVSCEEPGENVYNPGGVAISEAGTTLTGRTP